MATNLTWKILNKHIIEQSVDGLSLHIDQTLTQDATGTMAYLEFEALGMDRVKTELSVSYVDHNTAQMGPENANDHTYLQSIAAKTGVYFSRPGNGICHQVHLERFGRPGKTLLGSDSHTPTGGGIGMIAIGAGGLDVALAMGGKPFNITAPKVIGVKLSGQLPAWSAAKDIILHLLSILTTKGNVGCIVEYFGFGVATLSIPERATITNMGAELGVTTSVFPSDERTREFLTAQGRPGDWVELQADLGASYDRVIEIDLSSIEPLTAAPSSPDNIKTIRSLIGTKVNQVLIGSCTNSSFQDLLLTAYVLNGKTVHPSVSLALSPGSKQVLEMLMETPLSGTSNTTAYQAIVASGARILECACGPCIGSGSSPGDGQVSLRTFNRNFAGRTGTTGDQVFLVSPPVAVIAALAGEICVPADYARSNNITIPIITPPQKFRLNDNLIIPPLSATQSEFVEVLRPPTVGKPPVNTAMPKDLSGVVLIKAGDKTTTDHIMPAGAFLKYRSNIPEYAKVVFNPLNEAGKPTFAERALKVKAGGQSGIIVAGDSYGQGSSREHAAICPMYLGVRVVLAKSMERIHKANLINFGVLPLIFANTPDFDMINQDDKVNIANLYEQLDNSNGEITITIGFHSIKARFDLSPIQINYIKAGGLLAYKE